MQPVSQFRRPLLVPHILVHAVFHARSLWCLCQYSCWGLRIVYKGETSLAHSVSPQWDWTPDVPHFPPSSLSCCITTPPCEWHCCLLLSNNGVKQNLPESESWLLMKCLCDAMQVLGWPMLRQKRYLRWRWMQSSGMTQDMKFIIKSWWVIKQCFPCVHFEVLIQSWTSESLMAYLLLEWCGHWNRPQKVSMRKDYDFSVSLFNESKPGTMQCHQRGWKVTEPHMRGNSDSSCPCTAMWLDVLIWRVIVLQSIYLIVSLYHTRDTEVGKCWVKKNKKEKEFETHNTVQEEIEWHRFRNIVLSHQNKW